METIRLYKAIIDHEAKTPVYVEAQDIEEALTKLRKKFYSFSIVAIEEAGLVLKDVIK